MIPDFHRLNFSDEQPADKLIFSRSQVHLVTKQLLTKNVVKQRLGTVELALVKLDNDYQETTYRQNRLVAECIKSAREELDEAFQCFYDDNLQQAFELAGISWLHTDFARQLIDAEAIEHLLGESNYLELSHIRIPWENKAKQLMGSLEQEISLFRKEILSPTESK